MKRILPALLLAALAATAATAGHVRETLDLKAGWNAVYLESTPTNSAPADFFADLPKVDRVACHESSVYHATGQIASDGSEITQKPASFFVWVRGKEADSTLQRMLGGHAYFIHAKAAAKKTFYGVPARPAVSWQSAGDGGFMTILGVSIPSGKTVSSPAYLGEGPLSAESASLPYAVGGTNAAAAEYTPVMAVRGQPQLSGGAAYAFAGDSIADWPGVLDVSVPTLSGAISFPSGTSLQSFSVGNAGTSNRTVRVEYGPSELEGELQPSLMVYLPREGTNAAGWTAFATHDFLLAPGDNRSLVLAVDKTNAPVSNTTNAPATNAPLAALVTVTDLDGGTEMRVRIPVTAERDADDATAFPQGLWYGNVTLVQVDHLSDTNPVPAGGRMELKAMLLVGGKGTNAQVRLLQRIAVAAKDGDDGGTRLWPDTKDVPDGWTARRISTVFPDVATWSVSAAEGGRFGDYAEFDWTVAKDARDNPFRHVWHPDHKEGFDLTNKLTLDWHTESGDSTWEYSPDEVTYGICTWRIGGLLGKGDVLMRGTFALKRILDVSEVEE